MTARADQAEWDARGSRIHPDHGALQAQRPGRKPTSRNVIPADGSGDGVATRSEPGDYVEMIANMNLIVAVSACPVGDRAVPMTEPDKITTLPLGLEFLDTGSVPPGC